jgi:hypothetical protein
MDHLSLVGVTICNGRVFTSYLIKRIVDICFELGDPLSDPACSIEEVYENAFQFIASWYIHILKHSSRNLECIEAFLLPWC